MNVSEAKMAPSPGSEPPHIQTTLDAIKNIATLPTVAHTIIRITEDPGSTASDLNKVIASDPVLSMRILKVINSSFYGLSRLIDSIQHALLLLGFNAVKNIAIAASVHKIFKANQIDSGFHPQDLWKHAIGVATAARNISTKLGLEEPDEAFLAGLIHDVGIMVEMQALRPQFIKMLEEIRENPELTFCQAEEQHLGASHEAFGAALCRRWNFPPHLEKVAGFHHQPMQLPLEERMLPTIVHVADVLAARAGIGYSRTIDSEQIALDILPFLNLDESDLNAIIESLPEEVEESMQLLTTH